MLFAICFHLLMWNSDPIPLVLKSGTVLECESYKRVGDWVVVQLVEGFDVKATENGPRRFKVAVQKIDWDETEKHKIVAETRVDSRETIHVPRVETNPEKTRPKRPEQRVLSVEAENSKDSIPHVEHAPGEEITTTLHSQESKSNEKIPAPNQKLDDEGFEQSKIGIYRDRTFSGLGGDTTELFFLEAGPYVFEMKHNGLSKFGAQIIEQNGKTVQLLAKEVGDFWGSKAVNIELNSDYHINVQADGEWEISIGTSKESDSAALNQ